MIRNLLRLARPALLLLLGLGYLTGAALAGYLGQAADPLAFWTGFGWTLLLGAAAAWIVEFFRPPQQPLPGADSAAQRLALRRMLFWAFNISLLTAFALLIPTVLLDGLSLSVLSLLGAGLLLAIACGLPPLRLEDRGLGELAWALLIGNVSPALAFFLQGADAHRLLPLTIFPLTLLTIACLLALGFVSYAGDQRHGRRSLTLRLGWRRSLWVHHALTAGAYLLLACGPLLNVPLALIWPGFLSLPAAILQIFLLNQIAAGARPFWPAIRLLALAMPALSAYAMTLTFWIR